MPRGGHSKSGPQYGMSSVRRGSFAVYRCPWKTSVNYYRGRMAWFNARNVLGLEENTSFDESAPHAARCWLVMVDGERVAVRDRYEMVKFRFDMARSYYANKTNN